MVIHYLPHNHLLLKLNFNPDNIILLLRSKVKYIGHIYTPKSRFFDKKNKPVHLNRLESFGWEGNLRLTSRCKGGEEAPTPTAADYQRGRAAGGARTFGL